MVKHNQDDKGFLSRWSTRKQTAQQGQVPAKRRPEDLPGDAAPGVNPVDQESAQAVGTEVPFDPADLPDIETLDKDSDFSVFMSEKVPDALRRRALRRLWRVDPSFAFLDGMNDYDEDYTDAALVVEGLKTAYQVGKGMVTAEEPDALQEAEDQPPAAVEGEAPEPQAAVVENDDSAQGDGEAATTTPVGDPAPSDSAGAGAPHEPTGGAGDATSDSMVGSSAEREAAGPKQASRKPAGAALRRRWGDHSA